MASRVKEVRSSMITYCGSLLKKWDQRPGPDEGAGVRNGINVQRLIRGRDWDMGSTAIAIA